MDNFYEKYKDVRNMVWKVLTQYQLFDFPIDTIELSERIGIEIRTAETLPQNVYSVSLKKGNNIYILFQPSENEGTNRFTIAHELGHILMGHTTEKGATPYQEEEANIFASRLLAPMIVIKHNHIESAEQLATFFGLSLEAAKIRFERYKMLEKRDKFLTSPLEREYYENFCIAKHEPKKFI